MQRPPSRHAYDTTRHTNHTRPYILNLYLDVITASYLAICFPAEQTGERRAKACVLTVTVNANGEQGPSGAVVTYEALDRGRGTRTRTRTWSRGRGRVVLPRYQFYGDLPSIWGGAI